MARYTVSWQAEVEEVLPQLWSEAADKQAVTDAANKIDRDLSRDPAQRGEELHEGLHGLVVEPLRVSYTIDEGDRLVTVCAVRLANLTS